MGVKAMLYIVLYLKGFYIYTISRTHTPYVSFFPPVRKITAEKLTLGVCSDPKQQKSNLFLEIALKPIDIYSRLVYNL